MSRWPQIWRSQDDLPCRDVSFRPSKRPTLLGVADLICLTITENITRDAIRIMEKLPPEVDLVEVRADLLQDLDMEALLHAGTKPVVFTVRRPEEGGAFTGSEEERIGLLVRAKRSGAAYIDVEWLTPQEHRSRVLSSPGDAKVILSFHDFDTTPMDLFALFRDMASHHVDIIKIATFARNLDDNFRMFRLLQHMKHNVVAHVMGELGYISRILSPKFGSLWTYCFKDGRSKAAPGQISLNTLLDVYHVHRIQPDTMVYALLGNPIAHSFSPHMQNAAFRRANINAVYVPMQVTDLTSILAFFKEIDMQGCSVTIPFKVRILDVLDEVDDLARRMGAVNTVYVRDGKLIGTNTDGIGALRTIQAAGIQLTGSNVLVLGAGGSARAVGFTLAAARRLNALTFVSRRPDQAQILVRELSPHTATPLFASSFELSDLERAFGEADLVVNCTPVGMFPNVDETPVPIHLLKEQPIVFDIVYHPLMTRLLREAVECGCTTLTGIDMLVHQGAAQFEAWTGLRAPFTVMREAALKALQSPDPFSSR